MVEGIKKHPFLFILLMALIALSGNLLGAFAQTLFSDSVTLTYLSEGIFKYTISIFLLFLMAKLGYTKRVDKKKFAWRFLAGIPVVLYFANNLLPLVLVNPIHFKVRWPIVFVILFAEFSVGLMEETGIRGIFLPLLCEKWKEKKNVFFKAALVSSLLFGCLHLTWTVRQLLLYGSVSVEFLSDNLYQVFYTFCFGMLMAGISFYAKSIIPAVVWHSVTDVSAVISRGLLPEGSYTYYCNYNILTLQNVFYEYDIFPSCKYGAMIVFSIVNILLAVIGVILIKKAEKSI